MGTRSLALAAGLLALTLAGCPSGDEQPLLDAIRARGALRVGVEAANKPFEWQTEDGAYHGYDMELMQELARDLGVRLELVNTAWAGLIPSLQNGEFDCICSAMTITEERREAIDFSDAYFTTGQGFLVNKAFAQQHGLSGSEAFLRMFSAEGAPALILAVQQGTTGQFAAEQHFPHAEIRTFNTAAECALEVEAARANALVYDRDYLRYMELQHPETLMTLFPVITTEDYGIAIRKGESAFLAYVNAFLRRITDDGRRDPIYNRYFGENPEWMRQ